MAVRREGAEEGGEGDSDPCGRVVDGDGGEDVGGELAVCCALPADTAVGAEVGTDGLGESFFERQPTGRLLQPVFCIEARRNRHLDPSGAFRGRRVERGRAEAREGRSDVVLEYDPAPLCPHFAPNELQDGRAEKHVPDVALHVYGRAVKVENAKRE